MVGPIRRRQVKKALSATGTKKSTASKVRAHAQKAKTLLSAHKKDKKWYHNKVAIRVDN